MSRSDRKADFVADVLQGRDRSVRARLLRGALTPLSWIHHAGLEAYLAPYRTGIRKRHRLPVPVISIGNLSSGGTGKTPMAALIAGRLRGENRRVVVLSRGYGSAGAGEPRIVSNDERVLLGPEAAGDEPHLLARLLPGVPIVIGRDRRQSGRLAFKQFHPDVIVLDDALQFWQLHRDLDIVLLDAARPFDNGFVLPRGLLREPASHLSRAGIVVLTRADRVASERLEAIQQRVGRLAKNAEVFTARHAPIAWVVAGTGARLPTNALENRDVAAFAGIADCGAFVQTVEALGARVVHLRDFGDHHAYTADDLAPLAHVAADAVVTTEKDLVKVSALWPAADAPPLYALRIGMKVDDPPRFWERIHAAL